MISAAVRGYNVPMFFLKRWLGAAAAAFLLSVTAVTPARAQDGQGPVIDTVVVITENVYGPESPGFLRFLNNLRVKTRTYVVRRELLFESGERFDPIIVAETERNLRALGKFRRVAIDTVTLEDKFAVVVRTFDGWSTQLTTNFNSSGGRVTWALGLTETNFLGTANLVSAIYSKGIDRNSLTLGTRVNRLFGSRAVFNAAFVNFSDGTQFVWQTGLPFRSFSDKYAVEFFGEVADRQILQYFVNNVTDVDTTRFQRRALRNVAVAQYAPIANAREYLRLGAAVQVRREDYLLRADRDLPIPDSVTGAIGVFGEYRKANFKVGYYYNAFGREEDIDLSTVVQLTTWVAPSAFGYERNGIAPGVGFFTGAGFPSGYVKFQAGASGLFTSTGLDSGFVAVSMTAAVTPARKQATFLNIRGGVRDNPAPGSEFDLGFGAGPRSFGPHAFVGTRAIWGTLEHRVVAWDNLLGSLGIGFAGFLDYGGAWFPSQDPRYGGTVGFGLRFGSRQSTAANVGRIDFGYRFGDGWEGRRWKFTSGRAIVF